MTPVDAIARMILEGFDKHYRLFRAVSAQAKLYFETGDKGALQRDGATRIQLYDQRVREAVTAIGQCYPEAARDESLWPRIKIAFIGLLYEHMQPECAE